MKRGAATVAALAMLTLVGVATAALATRLADAADRTNRASANAQLRTGLLAGIAVAADRLENGQVPNVQVDLPSDFGVMTVQVESTDASAAESTIKVSATFGTQTADASAVLRRQGERWSVAATQLATGGQ